MNNYTPYHFHSTLSNPTTVMDSVTHFKEYIKKAQECGMKSFAFSEHGNIFEWLHKKEFIEAAGMKYIHGIEAYITEEIGEKLVRDNYHTVLLARNFSGVQEINNLVTNSFERDGHLYYNPRITLDELINTSNNIIICTACVGSILGKGTDTAQKKFISFLSANKERCFLEVQHHNTNTQKDYNNYLLTLSERYCIKLIAGTDTHCLNDRAVYGRKILQQYKKTFFDNEDGWDLTFKTYDELVECYRIQGVLSISQYMEAIENTNLMASMVESFEVDRGFKYPELYDEPEKVLEKEIYNGLQNNKFIQERYLNTDKKQIFFDRIKEEYSTFKHNGAIDFVLLQKYIRDWCVKNDIWSGPARGSSSGSEIFYLLGITEMDSLKFDIPFWRFMHKDRVNLADVDTDYDEKDRDRLKYFMLHDNLGIKGMNTCEIITFNTIALKGAIRAAGGGLNMPLEEVDRIAKQVTQDENKKDVIDKKIIEKYPELFEVVDIIRDCIISIGTHPSGVLVTTDDIKSNIGLCHTKDSKYPVSCLNMKELDSLNYVKEDILGLDNIGENNNACKLAGIERLNPDNIPLDDWNVWRSIRDDNTGIFQWESDFSGQVISKLFSDELMGIIRKELPDVSYLDIFTFGNALIRPCGASFRDTILNGKIHKTGVDDIDDLLKVELGACIMQETIMSFLMKFCGYSYLESDKVRKCIAKKTGTQDLPPAIKEGFDKNAKVRYGLSDSQADSITSMFCKCIKDAERYSFSSGHSKSYSVVGYIGGYLRYYYPLEFLTSGLNTFVDNEDKTNELIKYAKKVKISINPITFGKSKSEYYMDKETNSIYKGIKSIKFMNSNISDELYALSKNEYAYFVDLLKDIADKTSVNSRQLEILIKLDYFREFGNSKLLWTINKKFVELKQGTANVFKQENVNEAQISFFGVMPKSLSEKYKTDPLISMICKKYEFTERTDGCMDILRECEEYYKCTVTDDFSIGEKIEVQNEFVGYVDFCTHKPEDRTRLLILDIFPLRSKKTNEVWANKLKTCSLGTGKPGEILVYEKVFQNNPLSKYDVINVNTESLTKKEWQGKTSWYLNYYSIEKEA